LFNGFITFGTPHLGAIAANTLVYERQKVDRFISNAIIALAKGPALETVYNIVGGLPISLGLVQSYINKIEPSIRDKYIPAIIQAPTLGIEPQLAPKGVKYLKPMRTQNNACFYGIENDDDESLTARFLGAGISKRGKGLYGADVWDDDGIAAIHDAIDYYDKKYQYWDNYSNLGLNLLISAGKGLLTGSVLTGVLSGLNAISNKVAQNDIAKAYMDGKDWFTNTMNPSWKNLIGAGELTIVASTTDCECTQYEFGMATRTDIIPSGGGNCEDFNRDGAQSSYECQPVFSHVFVTYPSDGFILAESAMNGPGANYPPQLMPGSNHLQMRNDSKTKIAMKRIFSEGIDKTYFKSPK
jgi:hypothetical protein